MGIFQQLPTFGSGFAGFQLWQKRQCVIAPDSLEINSREPKLRHALSRVCERYERIHCQKESASSGRGLSVPQKRVEKQYQRCRNEVA